MPVDGGFQRVSIANRFDIDASSSRITPTSPDETGTGGIGAAQRSLVGESSMKAGMAEGGSKEVTILGARYPVVSSLVFTSPQNSKMEVGATGMPALHQEPDDTAVIGMITEALKQRIGTERFGLWFGQGVTLRSGEGGWLEGGAVVEVAGEFALQRIKTNFGRDLQAAVMLAIGRSVPVVLLSAQSAADQPPRVAIPHSSSKAPERTKKASHAFASVQDGPASIASLAKGLATGGRSVVERCEIGDNEVVVASSTTSGKCGSASGGSWSLATQGDAGLRIDSARSIERSSSIRTVRASSDRTADDRGPISGPVETMTFANFATASSNALAHTAAKLLVENPGEAAPLCFWGATGTGKTHLLHAIRHELRNRHRLPRVVLLSAEEFTNEFMTAVRGPGLPAFRSRYRDVDALLIDNIQFIGGKSATLREMLYTVDTILRRRKPLVFAGDRPPMDIDGLSAELSGRLSSGLVCGINPHDEPLRRELISRLAKESFLPWDEQTIDLVAQRVGGDGRAIHGIVRLVSMLQRMYRRMPTIDEIIKEAGDLLQRSQRPVGLPDIDRAVCNAFGLSTQELRGESKSRSVSQPRILAMYLSRQLTSAAFSEIGRYYGDRNHSTVIAAGRRVEKWLAANQPVGGRNSRSMSVQEAIDAVQNLLKIG